MATLVLTAVGTAIGGPVGGAIGALLGQAVDRSVLAGAKRREGPRLAELAVQTSSYGTQVPRLYGTMRVAGTVIWSTDLIEARSTARAGKGQPSVTSYSYSASFAVLLSARTIRGVGRIWADGNLLRGAAGDFKTVTEFRLHAGGEAQAADPLIASAVGAGLAPAHRGCAYAVFEGMQLADYGNRIPPLTFEVIADDAPVTVGAVARDLAAEVTGDAGATLGGFAASGGSVRAVLAVLAQAGGAWFGADGGLVVMRDGGAGGDGGAVTVADDGVAAGDAVRRMRSVAPVETVARTMSVAHYDAARDYQTGVQRARRPGAGSRDERLDMPAVLSAGEAKALATALLLRGEAERTRRTVAPGLAGWGIAPGSCVTVAGETGTWRVAEARLEAFAVSLVLVPLMRARPGIATADSGTVIGAPDAVAGATILHVFETPALDDALPTVPRLTVAACGTGPGWRRAALLYSLDDGASWREAGETAGTATIGTVVSAPGAAPASVRDLAGAFVVMPARGDMALHDADDRQLDAGANLALIGDELVQFGRAEPIGGGAWRLSRLLRGRRGTEGAAGTQAAGDRFVLIEAAAARTIELPLAALGTRVRVMASGVGDTAAPVEAATVIAGAALVPPSPVRLRAAVAANGDVTLSWQRRSRAGWRWIDGVDAPLGEESETYRVTLGSGGAPSIACAVPMLTVPAAALATRPITVAVRQRGTFGESPPATIVIGQV